MFKLLEHLFIFSFIDNCAVYPIAFLPFYFKCKHSNDSTLKQTARCFFNTALHINLRQRLFFFFGGGGWGGMGQELFVLEGFLLAFNPVWAILFRLEKNNKRAF